MSEQNKEEIKKDIAGLKEDIIKVKEKIENNEDKEIKHLNEEAAKNPAQEQLDEGKKKEEKIKAAGEKIITEAKTKDNIVKRALKKREQIPAVSKILMISKILVFACFIYAALVMYKIGRPYETILMVMAISLYLIFNKLDGG